MLIKSEKNDFELCHQVIPIRNLPLIKCFVLLIIYNTGLIILLFGVTDNFFPEMFLCEFLTVNLSLVVVKFFFKE